MEKITPIKQPNRMINYWIKEKFSLLIIVVSGTLYNIGMVFGPIWQGKLIDSLVDNNPLNIIFQLALTYLIIILIVMILRYIKRFYVRRFANNTNATMRLIIYNNILYSKKTKDKIGTVMTKVIADVDGCVEGMRKFTTEVFDTGVLLVTYIITMLAYDFKMTMIAVLCTGLAMFIAERLKTVIVAAVSKFRSYQAKLSGTTYDVVSNAIMYRVYGREKDNQKNYEVLNNEYTKSAELSGIYENSMQPVYNIIAMVGIIFVVIWGVEKIRNGLWTVGSFSAYVSIYTAMSVKASKGAKLFNSVQKATVSWNRIKPYLNEYQSAPAPSIKIDGDTNLKLNNVSFKYPDKEYLFKNLNLELHTGQIIGVTGPVACGKSSFGRIFLGNNSYENSITINGHELSSLNETDINSLFCYLGHDPQLISGTIKDNITLGKKGDITQVIKDVNFEEDLKTMPEKEETEVGFKGVRLSGGQQARVALARTLFNNSKIIILDDPFSAVDPKTEQIIMNNLRQHYHDHIFIIISHRLATFDQMDKVLLMNKDDSYVLDTHDNLLKTNALYKDLVTLQQVGDNHE